MPRLPTSDNALFHFTLRSKAVTGIRRLRDYSSSFYSESDRDNLTQGFRGNLRSLHSRQLDLSILSARLVHNCNNNDIDEISIYFQGSAFSVTFPQEWSISPSLFLCRIRVHREHRLRATTEKWAWREQRVPNQ